MPPKSKSKQSGGGNDDVKRDQKLQAIVMADSFARTFQPITWDTPKVCILASNFLSNNFIINNILTTS